MNKLEFFNDWYQKEEERRCALENSLNIPIGVLTFLYVLQFYLIKDFDYSNCNVFEKYSLLTFTCVSFIAAIISSAYIYKSYNNYFSGYKYTGLPYATFILKHEEDLIQYYNQHADYYENIDGKDKIEEYLVTKLAEYIDTNAYNNDKKSEFIHRSKRFLFFSIIFIIIAFIPFLFNLFRNGPQPDQVEITNLNSISQKFDSLETRIIKLEKIMAKKDTPPPPPQPPADRIIKEGQEPPPPPRPPQPVPPSKSGKRN